MSKCSYLTGCDTFKDHQLSMYSRVHLLKMMNVVITSRD